MLIILCRKRNIGGGIDGSDIKEKRELLKSRVFQNQSTCTYSCIRRSLIYNISIATHVRERLSIEAYFLGARMMERWTGID